MSIKESVNKRSLDNLGYSEEQINILIDLANKYESKCVINGYVTSLPAKFIFSTKEEIKGN